MRLNIMREGIETSRSTIILRVLANTVCVAALLPFVRLPFLPETIRTDAQPTGATVAIIVVLVVMLVAPGSLTITKTDLFLLACGVFSLIYVDWSNTQFDVLWWVRSTGQILLGFPVYYAVRNLYKYMSLRVFVFVVALYLVAVILQFAATPLYFTFASALLSDVRLSETGGLGGLAQEPSQLGTLAIFFILAPLIFKKDSWKTHRRAYWFVILASIFMLTMTQSATAALLVIVLLLAWFFALSRVRIFWKILLSVGLLAISLVARNVEVPAGGLNRAESIALEFARNPLYVIQDPSLAMRQTGLYVGLINLTRIPFGNGSVFTDYSLVDDALRSPIMNWLVRPEDWPVVYAYAMGTYMHPTVGFVGGGISLLGQGIQRMGIFYLAIIGYLITLIRGPRESLLFQILFLTFITNGPLAMSVIWFLLGCFAEVKGREIVKKRGLDRLPPSQSRSKLF